MTWLFNEDAALKFKLQGLTVTDITAPQGGRLVGVRYRLPENEVADLDYPVIIIEHAGLFPAPEREHSGINIQIPYAPEGNPPWWDNSVQTPMFDPTQSPYFSWFPSPYNFDYEITFYSRLSHFHMIPVVQTLASYNYLPYHYGYLDIPQDGTKRTMQLLGGPEFGYENDADGKRRYFVKYKVRVFSELFLQPIVPSPQLGPPVQHVVITLNEYTSIVPLSVQNLSEAHGILSVSGPAIRWNDAIPPIISEALFPERIRRQTPARPPHRTSRSNF